MKKYLIFFVLLIIAQVSAPNYDLVYEGRKCSAATLSERLYEKVLGNYSYMSWISIKNYFFLLAAAKCYENMNKSDARLSSKARSDLQNILNNSESLFGSSWESIRFKCRAFCLMYGGYLLPDEQIIEIQNKQ